MNKESVNKWALLGVVLFISVVFITMVRGFLMAILLAGIISALSMPLYRRLSDWFGGRPVPASIATIVFVTLAVVLPLLGLLGIIAAQAIKVASVAQPWIEQQLSGSGNLMQFLQTLPFWETIEPHQKTIISKAGQFAGTMGGYVIDKLSSATMGTVAFFVNLFIMLYCMFFFLMQGADILKKMLYYLPLGDDDEQLLLGRFTSVARATLRGTLVIGALQGGLAGAAFAVVGIPSAVFWGTIMAVLSVIPSVGSALVWAPAAIYLGISGQLVQGIGLFLFCAVVVGSLDNLLRPVLVGKDTQMHELMILFGTLGGIIMFGIVGMIIGPIIAALFVTAWEIYGMAFKDVLPEVKMFADMAGPSERRPNDNPSASSSNTPE